MLISCTSCNSKYLVNSADLKPNGRTVQCAKCGNQWFQKSNFDEEIEIFTQSVPSTSFNSKSEKKVSSITTPNLPSTYVKEETVSVLNSILVILFIIILIGGFWVIRNLEINTLVLLKFYIDEFYFNIKLIFNDISKLIYQIIN